jgi:rhodanese-related sulfurtransferase
MQLYQLQSFWENATRLAGHNMTGIINRKELQMRLSKTPAPVLLEALPAKYYLEGHLAGALHFPHERARALAPLLVPDKQNSIIVYCASEACQNSHLAAAALAGLGYLDVSVYAGGKKDWTEAGLPLIPGGTAQQAA